MRRDERRASACRSRIDARDAGRRRAPTARAAAGERALALEAPGHAAAVDEEAPAGEHGDAPIGERGDADGAREARRSCHDARRSDEGRRRARARAEEAESAARASEYTLSMNRHPLASATALMTSAALLFGVMAILAKGAAARLPGPQIAFVRFIVGPRRLRRRGDALPPARAQLARPVLARRVRRRRGALLLPGHRAPHRRHGDAAQLHGAGVRGAVGLALPRRAHRARHRRRAGGDHERRGGGDRGQRAAGRGRARAVAVRRHPVVGAVGRGDGDDPRGAQDRRRVGDLLRLLHRGRDLHRRAGVAAPDRADGARVDCCSSASASPASRRS